MSVNTSEGQPLFPEGLSPMYAELDSVYGLPTFYGVLKNYFYEYDSQGNNVGISKNWDQDPSAMTTTRADNIGTYNRVILPYLPKNIALENYSAEDYLAPIEVIYKTTYMRGTEEKKYEQSTIEGYRRLIRYVYEKALEKKIIIERVLKGTSLTEKPLEENEIQEEKFKLRKSFSPLEEMAFFDKLTQRIREKPAETPGEVLGILMMLFLGLRNHEVAGLSFGDMRPMHSYPDRSCLLVYKTTMQGSSVLKGSGKTPNAVRRLPIPAELETIILERKYLVEEYLSEQNEFSDVDAFPIACKGLDFSRRCSSGDISSAGRKFLLELNFPARRLAIIEEILRHDESSIGSHFFRMGVDEKDPTTYLLRKNAATRMYHAGLSDCEIQFFIGHKIEDIHIARSDFSNEDLLISLVIKLEQHPIYRFVANRKLEREHDTTSLVELNENNSSETLTNTRSAKLVIPPSSKERELLLIIDEQEPFGQLHLGISHQTTTTDNHSTLQHTGVFGTITKTPSSAEYGQTVDILNEIHRVYYDFYLAYKKQGVQGLFLES